MTLAIQSLTSSPSVSSAPSSPPVRAQLHAANKLGRGDADHLARHGQVGGWGLLLPVRLQVYRRASQARVCRAFANSLQPTKQRHRE